MGETLKIDYLNRDSLNATIWVDGKNVKLKSYTSDIIRSVQPGYPDSEFSYDDYLKFLESRCFQRSCADASAILKAFDLDYYDPTKIVRITHGVLFADFNWFRFNDEEFDINKFRTEVMGLPW